MNECPATGSGANFAYIRTVLSSEPQAILPSLVPLRPTKFFSFTCPVYVRRQTPRDPFTSHSLSKESVYLRGCLRHAVGQRRALSSH
jgi:hypothetical protein